MQHQEQPRPGELTAQQQACTLPHQLRNVLRVPHAFDHTAPTSCSPPFTPLLQIQRHRSAQLLGGLVHPPLAMCAVLLAPGLAYVLRLLLQVCALCVCKGCG